jgi:arylsulfatase A-like enzyme
MFLLLLHQGRGAAAAAATTADATARPNILLLTTDQQRVDTVAAYANDRGQPGKTTGIASPSIDKLAREGVRFTDAHSSSPICSPCRTSLLTGVNVPVHGVLENTIGPHKSNLTVYSDVLKGIGYTCFWIGKTHVSPVPDSFYFVDAHSGNTNMRCDDEDWEDGSCEYYNEDDFLETYLVNTFIEQISDFMGLGEEGRGGGGGGGGGGGDKNQTDDDVSPWFVHLSFVSPHPPSTPPTEVRVCTRTDHHHDDGHSF